MASRDVKQFMFGAFIGLVVAYLPKMLPSVSILKTMTDFIPNMVAGVLPSGVSDFIVVGDPSFLSVVLHMTLIGLILMFAKK